MTDTSHGAAGDGGWLPERPLGDRIAEYWEWVAVALFLLTAVDTLTTAYAAATVGVAYEGNPLVRRLLARSVFAVAVVNVAAAVVAAVGFRGVVATLRRTPPRVRPYYALVVEVWLGLLVAAGLLVFANNVAVVVLGESLL